MTNGSKWVKMDDRTRRIVEQLRARPRPPAVATPEEWEAALDLVERTDPHILELAARLSRVTRPDPPDE